ncbi:MAG: hypothetical protein IKS87_05215 [Lachnospiraceae bacterium]|nr:hypothetical protein [Lachnospiraceae bacterium]
MSILYEYDRKKHMQFEREEALLDGSTLFDIKLIQKKVAKGKTLDVIADELESSVEEIRPIYDSAVRFPTDTDPEIVLKDLKNRALVKDQKWVYQRKS